MAAMKWCKARTLLGRTRLGGYRVMWARVDESDGRRD